MAITDYASLKTAISDFSHRADLTSYLDDFIKLAEERLASTLRVRELETQATGTFSAITEALPADFAALRRLTIVSSFRHSPVNIGADGLRTKYKEGTGLPSYYSIVGSSLEFDINPSGYTYELDYYKKPVAITSTNTTSDLLTNYPGIYLYSCLVEVAWYTKNDQDIQRYTAKLAELVDSANKRSRPDGGPLQIVTG